MATALLLGATAAETEAEAGFPAFNPEFILSQVFWIAITFVFLYLVLSRLIIPRLASTVERRQDTIVNDLDEAHRLQTQAEEAKQALEVRLAEARAKARETADAASEEMRAEVDRKTEQVEAEIDQKLEEADEAIVAMREKALTEVDAIAVDAAEQLIVRLGGSADAGQIRSAVATARKGQ